MQCLAELPRVPTVLLSHSHWLTVFGIVEGAGMNKLLLPLYCLHLVISCLLSRSVWHASPSPPALSFPLQTAAMLFKSPNVLWYVYAFSSTQE